MKTSKPNLVQAGPPAAFSVLLDGCVVGSISSSKVEKVVAHLRRLKVAAAPVVCFCPLFVFFPFSFFSLAFLSNSNP